MTALQVPLPQTRSLGGQLPTLSIGPESRVPVDAELGSLQTQLDGGIIVSICLQAMLERLIHLARGPQRTDSWSEDRALVALVLFPSGMPPPASASRETIGPCIVAVNIVVAFLLLRVHLRTTTE